MKGNYFSFILFDGFSRASMTAAGEDSTTENNGFSTSMSLSTSFVSPTLLTTMNSSDLEAHLSPYLLHHSVAPTTIFVTQPLVEVSNYVSWSKAMLLGLSGKNKLEFINGAIKKTMNLRVLCFQLGSATTMSSLLG